MTKSSSAKSMKPHRHNAASLLQLNLARTTSTFAFLSSHMWLFETRLTQLSQPSGPNPQSFEAMIQWIPGDVQFPGLHDSQHEAQLSTCNQPSEGSSCAPLPCWRWGEWNKHWVTNWMHFPTHVWSGLVCIQCLCMNVLYIVYTKMKIEGSASFFIQIVFDWLF